jgi:hypothetical protein
VTALLEGKNLGIPKFESGDAGIILKASGEFIIWNCFPDPANPTEHEREVGKTLMALAAAIRVPQILDVLNSLANDANIFPKSVDTGVKQ